MSSATTHLCWIMAGVSGGAIGGVIARCLFFSVSLVPMSDYAIVGVITATIPGYAAAWIARSIMGPSAGRAAKFVLPAFTLARA
jgi:hypothetical protein